MGLPLIEKPLKTDRLIMVRSSIVAQPLQDSPQPPLDKPQPQPHKPQSPLESVVTPPPALRGPEFGKTLVSCVAG